MKTRFIIIRHGFSIANDQKRFAGHSDFELTELGKCQAEKCAEALKNEKIDAIYASDLKRAFFTAIPVARSHSLEINASTGLREIFAGEWEGRLFDEIDEKYKESYSVWKNDIGNALCDGGESIEQLYVRVLNTLREIAAENQGKTVCIATHATPIRALCAAAAGLGSVDMARIKWVSNASINIFDFDGERFLPIAIDSTDHLGDIKTNLPSNV